MSDTPIVDAYPTSAIEREIHFALNPVGMSVHSGKVMLACDHVQHLLSRARDLESKLTAERKRADEAIRRLQYMHSAHSDSVQWYQNATAQALKSLNALPAKMEF